MTSFVFLHGYTGDGACWARVIAALPSGARTLAPSLIGHDHGPSSPATFDGEVDRIATLAKDVKMEGGHLVGYSLGGRVALRLVLRHPKLFSRVTLIGASPGLRTEAEREQRRAHDEIWARRLETKGIASFVDAWEAQPIFASQAKLPLGTRADARRRRLAHDPFGLAVAMRCLGTGAMPDCWDLLGSCETEVGIVAGALDEKFVAIGRAMSERLPRAKMYVVPGVGHNAVLEAPEAITEIL